jgi:hypothetical protein
MITAVAIAAVLILGRLVFIYYHPFGPCRRCAGKGTNPFSTPRRKGFCRRCGGSRQTQRLGSRALHKMVRGTSNAVIERKKKRL